MFAKCIQKTYHLALNGNHPGNFTSTVGYVKFGLVNVTAVADVRYHNLQSVGRSAAEDRLVTPDQITSRNSHRDIKQ